MGYITMDVGTTNTRVRYVEATEILASFKANIGVKDCAISGTSENLKKVLKKGIIHCLNESNKALEDIGAILASGMITSNLGLVELPHLETPVGLEDFTKHIQVRRFDDIVEKPIHFIPGVKNRLVIEERDAYETIDMMRGEEVEALGALALKYQEDKLLFVSPGSHTKFVFFNSNGEIEACSTTLTGEILWALSKETILAESISKDLITKVDSSYLLKGIEASKTHGFTKACFLVRILHTFSETTPNQRANFLAGALFYEDLKSIENRIKDRDYRIIIGGKKILRELYGLVFAYIGYDNKKVTLLKDEESDKISSLGAIKIYEYDKHIGDGD